MPRDVLRASVTVFLDEVHQRVAVPGGRDHLVSTLKSGNGPLATEAAGGACDEPYFGHGMSFLCATAQENGPVLSGLASVTGVDPA